MPRPEYSIAPPALQQFQTNEMDVFAPPGTAAARSAGGDAISVGAGEPPAACVLPVYFR